MWRRSDKFEKKIPYLRAQAKIFAAVRAFFDARGYLEVGTSALQAAPCKITFDGKTCDAHQPWEKLTVVEALRP